MWQSIDTVIPWRRIDCVRILSTAYDWQYINEVITWNDFASESFDDVVWCFSKRLVAIWFNLINIIQKCDGIWAKIVL